MKIIISSTLRGTAVTDESGEEIFNNDKAGDIALFCEGLKKEFPEAEFVFDSNPARGAVFEAGRKAGEKLKQESTRYKISCSVGSLVSSLTSTTDGVSQSEILEIYKKNTEGPEIESCIIIDQLDKIVEIIKGSIDPFKEELDKELSGWKIGKIKRK